MDCRGVATGDRLTAVSALRREEDLAFAKRVGLHQIVAGLDDAPARGRKPLDPEKSLDDSILLNAKVIDAIIAARQEGPVSLRPWLYCPMGIGGHVDHLAVLRIVTKNYDALRRAYRIAFYEDLPYAADWQVRVIGLSRFRKLIAPLVLKRTMRLIGDARYKLDLVNLYGSQFVQPHTSVKRFTPALHFSAPAHEGIWTVSTK
jgi:hypothetical protein